MPQVGRVRTEEAILSTVDHPFLATLYGTLQTGARSWAAAVALGPPWLQEQLLSCLSAPGCRDSAPVRCRQACPEACTLNADSAPNAALPAPRRHSSALPA